MGLGIGFVFLIINTFKGKLFSSVWRHRGKRHQEKFKRWKIGHAGKTRPTERNRIIFQEKKRSFSATGFLLLDWLFPPHISLSAIISSCACACVLCVCICVL